MTNTTCPKCGKEVIEKQKKNGQGTFKVNLDGSYHTVPVTQGDGTTKWYCATSKEHGEWTKSHNGPSGFVEPKQIETSFGQTTTTHQTYKPQINELEAILDKREISEIMNLARETVLDAFYVADTIVHNIYPNLSKSSGTYGQIRSKFTDQIIQAYKTVTLEQAVRDNNKV